MALVDERLVLLGLTEEGEALMRRLSPESITRIDRRLRGAPGTPAYINRCA